MPSYGVYVVQKHQSYQQEIPWRLIRLNRKNQLTWGVVKFLIAKKMGQFKNKTYTYDIDGVYYYNYANTNVKNFKVENCILNNSYIIYSVVPIYYKESTHFIPYNAIDWTVDINEDKIITEYY